MIALLLISTPRHLSRLLIIEYKEVLTVAYKREPYTDEVNRQVVEPFLQSLNFVASFTY